MPRSERDKNLGLWVLIAIAALSAAVYFPVFAGKVPFPRDMVLQFSAWSGMARSEAWRHYADIGDLITSFYPSRVFAAEAVRAGTLPLWNPYYLSGAPFLANPQSSLFYPPNALYYVFSTATAWTLCIILRVFLSGLFMALFVRKVGASNAGALFAGIVFSLCGFMTAWQAQPMVDAATWLPLACYVILRLHDTPSPRSIAVAAFAFAMPVLAGHPETAAHVTFVAIAFALVTFAGSGFDMRFLGRFTLAGALAIGLAAIQLIPTLEWLRSFLATLDARWPPLEWHEALSWFSRDILRAPNSAGLWIPQTAAYAGMITLVLAPLGLFHRERRHVVFFFVLSLVCAGIAYGVEPMHWLANHTPILAGLKNSRLVFVAGFGLAALAGLGISVLEESRLAGTRRILPVAAVGVAFVIAFVCIYELRAATQFRVEFTRRPSFSRALLIAGFVPIVAALWSERARRVFPWLACAIVAFDLVTFSYGYTGFAGRDEIYPPAPLFDFLSKQGGAGSFRIAQLSTAYPLNVNMVYHVASADGYEVRIPPSGHEFWSDYAEKRMETISFTPASLLKQQDRRLDMLNVRYVVTLPRIPEFDQFKNSSRYRLVYQAGDVAVFENTSVLPRAFAVPASGIEVEQDMNRQLSALRDPNFDPQRRVLLFEPKIARTSPEQPAAMADTIEQTKGGINEAVFHTSTAQPSVVVVSQTYFPGWKATIDGNAAEVFPVDVTLTGIALPAGTHDLHLVFDPMSFKVGAAVSVLTVLLLLGYSLSNDKRLISANPITSV